MSRHECFADLTGQHNVVRILLKCLFELRNCFFRLKKKQTLMRERRHRWRDRNLLNADIRLTQDDKRFHCRVVLYKIVIRPGIRTTIVLCVEIHISHLALALEVVTMRADEGNSEGSREMGSERERERGRESNDRTGCPRILCEEWKWLHQRHHVLGQRQLNRGQHGLVRECERTNQMLSEQCGLHPAAVE